MAAYTFYNNEGKIELNVNCSEEVLDSMVAQIGSQYIEGFYPINKYYIVNDLPVEMPERPNEYSEFNYTTKIWELREGYLTQVKIFNTKLVNQEAMDTILRKYPYYRQLNNPDDLEMKSWISDIRERSNIANIAIDLATDLVTIENIVNTFQNEVVNL